MISFDHTRHYCNNPASFFPISQLHYLSITMTTLNAAHACRDLSVINTASAAAAAAAIGCHYTNSDWRPGHHLKNFDPNVRKKFCQRSKIDGNILRIEGQKIDNSYQHASHHLFCYTSKPPQQKINKYHLNKKTCDDFNVARSTVRIC